MFKYIIFGLCFLLSFSLQAQPEKGSLLIKNGTILTITNGVLENTDVYIREGKIFRIGKNIKGPKEVRIIDATGMFVMPGIIDAHSHAGLSAINEGTNPITPEVAVGDAVEPTDITLYRALAGGVTASHAMHGSANAIGGQCITLKHRWGETDPENFIMEGAPRTIKFALGENPMRVHGERSGVNPSSRMGVEQVIRKAFADAQDYQAAWKKHEANPETDAPAYSLRLQTMVDIMEGKILIHCHSYRADEILMLLEVLADYGVKDITFQHTNEGFKVAPELAAFGAHASVFSDWWAYKFEVYYSTAYNAAILTKNGVITSINSDSGELIRHLYHEAAKTQRYGSMTDNQALRMITLNPAIQLGIDDRVGSIEKGKDGDIAIFKNHPLSIYAVPQQTIIDGVVRFDINQDADDMRLSVNPEEKVMPILYYSRDLESCLEGTTMENK
ncbi:MAG: amidohydrolase family protein [Bacteroidota bacterium]